MAAPEVLIPGLAADSGLTRPHDIPAIPSDETVGDDEAGDDEVGVGSAGEREEYAFGGELIAGEPEPSDDSLWLARLELLRRMPHLDVPFEAKNAHLRIVELELAGRRFQRSLVVDWLVQTLIAEAAWLVESVDEVEQRLGGLTGRYRVSSGKLLADTFISASLLATEPSTREHLFENGLRLCDKLLMSSEPESCKSVLEVLDSLLPSDQRESQRSTVYLKDYLSAADEMIRYVEVGDGAEVLSDPSPVKQGESLGRYDCFLRRDWETGLPWLVETANPLIAGTARDELALTESDEATKFKTVAEQWLVASSETIGRPADSMRLHAIDLLRRARERSSGPLTDTIDRQLDRLIETVPGHLLPADDWNSAWDFDPNYRFNRPEPRTAPHRSWPTL